MAAIRLAQPVALRWARAGCKAALVPGVQGRGGDGLDQRQMGLQGLAGAGEGEPGGTGAAALVPGLGGAGTADPRVLGRGGLMVGDLGEQVVGRPDLRRPRVQGLVDG